MAILIEAKTAKGEAVGYYLCSQGCFELDKKAIAEKYQGFVVEEVIEDTEPSTCTSCEECGEVLQCDSVCDEDDCEGREFWNEQNAHANAYYYG